jgi:glycosyltransferase involved in cell wall biosynthesis
MPMMFPYRLPPPPQSVPHSYTLIVPTYNRAELLARALRSIQQLAPVADTVVEVLVVDNNSTDTTALACMASEGTYRVRRVVEGNQGLNHARNRAWQEATGDFLVYLDDDMEIAPGWLTACHAGLTLNPAHAVSGPVQPRFESPPASWLAGELRDSVTSAYSRRGDVTHFIPHTTAHQLPGCNFGVWRTVVRALGGFHPALDRSGSGMLSGGDTEFGLRMVAAGGSTLYIPGCGILHLVSDAKVSFRGLARRWLGLGRTQRALDILTGQSKLTAEQLKRARRVLGNTARAGSAILRNDRGGAVYQYMSALRNWGMLTYDSRHLKPVPPLVDLADAD